MGRIMKNGINYSGGIVPNSSIGFYANNLYLSNINSDISTYKTLSYTIDGSETEKSLTLNSSQGEQLIESYLYPLGIGITTIDAGLWTSDITAKVSSTAGGSTTMRMEFYVRHIDNSETILFSRVSNPITAISYATVVDEITKGVFTVVSTDRFGIKIYVTTTRPQNTTINYIVGNGRGAHFTLPLTLRHSQLRDKNEENGYQHITSTQKTEMLNPTFTEATAIANIASGESATTLWGKVMKFMSIFGTGLSNVAPVYSASSTYGIGAFVLNNNKLYRCSTAISAPEAFNATKWTSITLIDFLTVQTFATSVSNATYGTNNSSSLSKVGKLVTFNLFYNNNIAAIPTGSPVIFTLPVGSRPASQTYVNARCLNNPSTNSVILICRTDGTVTYEDNIGTPLGCYIDGSVTFVTNQ